MEQNLQASPEAVAQDVILYSWGDAFPTADPDWELVVASDILLYVKQYSNLVKTMSFLLMSYKPKSNRTYFSMENEQSAGPPRPAFLMSWRRRIWKENESLFFTGYETAGLEVQHLGSHAYCIKPKYLICEETI